jgi:hypothetical protein
MLEKNIVQTKCRDFAMEDTILLALLPPQKVFLKNM